MSRTITKLFVVFLVAGVFVSSDTVRSQNATPPLSIVANEVLVEFEPWVTDASKDTLRRVVGVIAAAQINSGGVGRLERLRLSAGSDVNAAIQTLRNSPFVRIAEPNWIYRHEATSNDPFYTNGSLWGMYGDTTPTVNQFGSQAGEAWTAGAIGSSSVYVAVIDEGIDFNHPDLGANIWTNPFDPIDGNDNDGNGYVDDIHGWDFFSNNNTVYDGAPGNTTLDAHGTHVSGTIGGVGGNGAGVAGVNWNVTIIPAKFLGPNGGTTAAAVAALNYIIDLKQRHGLNIVATNNSWGGGGYSQTLHDAILRAAKAGILFVAAAGNSATNNDIFPNYPSNYSTLVGTSTESAASYEAVIAVASLTSTGAISSFSSYGATTVDLGAPGSAIISTTPSNTYSSFSGTSMATPHVTGAAALYQSINPGATAQQTRTAILQTATATPTASLSGKTATGGRLNIGFWFTGPPPPVPAAPTSLGATAVSSSEIDLSWVDNANNETGFTVERCAGASCTNFVQTASLAANTTSYQNLGLVPSTTYRYQVRAVNGSSNSAYSNIASATTSAAGPGAPADPTNLTATPVTGPKASWLNISWTDNSSNETGFKLERCTGAGCTNFAQFKTFGANTTFYEDYPLTLGTTYRYRVLSYNAAGNSGYSNIAEGTPGPPSPTAPAAPSALGATPVSSSQINLAWTDNANNESGFSLERCAGASCTNFAPIASLAANTTSYPDTGLSAGTYRYQVRAFNGNGNSAYSNIASATVQPVPTPPAAPTGLGASAGSSSQINLSWTDNASDETGFSLERCTGASCTNFVPIASLGAGVTSYQNTGLAASTTFRYQVRAFNSAGNSAYSNIASATTLASAPGVPADPSNLTVTLIHGANANWFNVAWTDNSNNETGFKLERCLGAGCTNFTLFKLFGANVTLYEEYPITSGTTYRYRVKSTNASGDSGYSNIGEATAP